MRKSHPKLSQDIAQPHDLFASLNCSDVFSFSVGQGHNGLQFASPGNGCSSASDQIATCRSSIVHITPMVCIRVSEEGLRILTSLVNKLIIQCALNIAHEVSQGLPMLRSWICAVS